MPVSDPCVEADRLRDLRTAIISGEGVNRARFDTKEVQYWKADLAALDRLIADYDKQCAINKGETPRRTRYAKRMRFGPC